MTEGESVYSIRPQDTYTKASPMQEKLSSEGETDEVEAKRTVETPVPTNPLTRYRGSSPKGRAKISPHPPQAVPLLPPEKAKRSTAHAFPPLVSFASALVNKKQFRRHKKCLCTKAKKALPL